MRRKNSRMLVLIAVITLVSVWICLPGSSWDIGGIRANHPVREGLDLQGGLQVTLEARPPEGVSIDSDTLEGTRDTLERRVNGLGVSEPLIQTRGNNQIVVELPGVDESGTGGSGTPGNRPPRDHLSQRNDAWPQARWSRPRSAA